MPGEIKIPGIGDVEKKYIIGGVLVGAGIGVIVYFRSKNKANAAAATASTSGAVVTDPAGNTCSVLDPNSGYCPGSPEDVAYQESASGSYSGVGFSGGQYGGGTGVSLAGLVTDPAGNQCSAVNPATGYCPGSPQDVAATGHAGSGGGGGAGGVSTNTDWINEALGVLPGDQTTIRTALVDVLAGMTVTTAQKNIFTEAVGVIGQPPGGYPQPIKTSDTAGHPGPGSTGRAGAISNLQPSSVSPNSVTIHWNPTTGASQGYAWALTGNGVDKKGNTKSTSVTVTGLASKKTYNFGVQGLPGGPGDNIHVTTK
jgi:hypothetical protein